MPAGCNAATHLSARRSGIRKRGFRVATIGTSGSLLADPGYALVVLEESKNIDSTLEPLDEYLVIQPVSDETETRAGLILPASALATIAVRTGIVTAVGSEPNGIEVGDKVLYPFEAGYDVRLGGIEVKVLKRSELIGRIHD